MPESAMTVSKPIGQDRDKNPQAVHDAAAFGIDMCQLEYLLTLTPEERLRRHDAALEFVIAARKAGIRYYGFDPRSSETPQ